MSKTIPTGLPDPKQAPEVDKRCENCKWWQGRTITWDGFAHCSNTKIVDEWRVYHSAGLKTKAMGCCNNWQQKEE